MTRSPADRGYRQVRPRRWNARGWDPCWSMWCRFESLWTEYALTSFRQDEEQQVVDGHRGHLRMLETTLDHPQKRIAALKVHFRWVCKLFKSGLLFLSIFHQLACCDRDLFIDRTFEAKLFRFICLDYCRFEILPDILEIRFSKSKNSSNEKNIYWTVASRNFHFLFFFSFWHEVISLNLTWFLWKHHRCWLAPVSFFHAAIHTRVVTSDLSLN